MIMLMFKAVLFDCQRKTIIGSVEFSPATNFQRMCSFICYLIGISPGRLSVHVVDSVNINSRFADLFSAVSVHKENVHVLPEAPDTSMPRRKEHELMPIAPVGNDDNIVNRRINSVRGLYNPLANTIILRKGNAIIVINDGCRFGLALDLGPVLFDRYLRAVIGNVHSLPVSDFHGLLSALCKKIGVSQDQFYAYLAEREKRCSSIPVSTGIDFSPFSSEKGNASLFLGAPDGIDRQKSMKDNQLILPVAVEEDDQNVVNREIKSGRSPYDPPTDSMLLMIDNNRIAYSLSGQDLASLAGGSLIKYLKTGLDLDGTGSGSLKEPMAAIPCEECERERKMGPNSGFHCCVNDPIIVGFSTLVGPISGPSSNIDPTSRPSSNIGPISRPSGNIDLTSRPSSHSWSVFNGVRFR